MEVRHPAKYTDSFIREFYDILKNCDNVLDPFAGTGKIGMIKSFGYKGKIYANELEPEWLKQNKFGCDVVTFEDAEILNYPNDFFDAVCTSPTYGNRMADHHNANDGSKRNTYTHCLGRTLNDENTGKMQWGKEYRRKHIRIYIHLYDMIKPNGIFVLNIKNHIRNGKEINVKEFHCNALVDCGFIKEKEIFIETHGNCFGKNSELRTNGEYIVLFRKPESCDK